MALRAPLISFSFFFCFTGVALLPFVDEKRLLGALSIVYPDLTEKESKYYIKYLTLISCYL